MAAIPASPLAVGMPRPLRRGKLRAGTRASAGAYALFYCAVALGVGLLAYAGMFLSGPPAPSLPVSAKTMHVAKIQLNQSDRHGRCRQVVFDNATGNFEEAGMSRCRNLIPEELLIDTVQTRAGYADAFTRAFRR